ncbi:MAG: helix-turn-helix domain-containing protein [Proteobacteria bacterium]|nr:helix-turn-helix domain-containing protein [Pseudomonadota bacterium]MBS0302785.1 helix-turn-helix domain-containing protein [Pseudomonadota bacterium]
MARVAPSLVEPSCSVRRYNGERGAHEHGFAQILYALDGSMELDIAGRAALVDGASGIVIPAGVDHGYCAERSARILVIDAPEQPGLSRMRRFAVPPHWRGQAPAPQAVAACVAAVLQAPGLLARRRIDLPRLAEQVQPALHQDWPTARLAALCHLSAQRFHARLVELTGRTPQAWLRDLRLTRAAQLLARGQPLETTALACGYASASALAYALRRERGVGARDLRRLNAIE